MKTYLLVPVLLLFSIICSQLVLAQSLEDLLKDGDKYVSEFNNEKALQIYQDAEKKFPENWEVYWRLSRSYIDIGEHLPSSTDEQKEKQLEMFKMAKEYSDKTIKLVPNESIGYVRRAIANGKIALFEGVFSSIGTVKDVKADCEKAIQLGTGGNYVQALAHYVLGRAHLKVCEKAYLVRLPLGLGWGDTEEAVRLLETAVKLKPNFRMFYFELAKAYVEEDEYDKARETLRLVEKAPVADEDDETVLAEAKKLYQQIKDE